jgi:flavin reductase (DIM6/NTAB) family NADH-FMN oxidoreductase RutF
LDYVHRHSRQSVASEPVGVVTVIDISRQLRRTYGAYPTGVAAIAGLVDGSPVGIAASSFVPVSLDPPLVSVCVAHTSRTWPQLRNAPRIGISVLGDGQDRVCRQLAAKGVDRFAGLSWHATAAGCVLLDEAVAWFDCTIDKQVRAGDHDIVLFGIHDLDAVDGAAPLVFHASEYRRLA